MRDRLDLIASLRAEIVGVLRPLLRGARRVALLDFPNHTNVGDSAIWLGQLRALADVGVARIAYSCDVRTYSPGLLERCIGDAPILISGGGSTGDLWERHQRFHEEVIAAFPRNRIILLPQSIRFARDDTLARARAVFGRHPDLILLIRDASSLEFARRELPCASMLCPDMAFALGPLSRPAPATREMLWLGRDDLESLPSSRPPGAARNLVVDWLDESPTSLATLGRRLTQRLARPGRERPVLRRVLSSLYRPLARQRLGRGCRILSDGRIVVTDRLHGHILCLLLGIPHIVLDNSYGKVSAFHRTWTLESPVARRASSAADALAMLRRSTCA